MRGAPGQPPKPPNAPKKRTLGELQASDATSLKLTFTVQIDGKTFTALKIAEELAASRKIAPTTVLFLVPSIQLLNQSLREWKQESELPFRAFAVCSDVQVGKSSPTEDFSVNDLIYPATTDTAVLAREIKKLHEHDQFTVVFSTYQSIDVVAKAQQDGVPAFDLIICDEAHRTTGVTLAGDD